MAGKRDLAEIRNIMEELTDRLTNLSDEAKLALLEESGALVSAVRDKAGDMLTRAREKTQEVTDKARAAGKQADEYAHDEPWKVAAGAALVGALIGFAMASRRK